MTPTTILYRLWEDERHWAAVADDDELNSFQRHGAISRRDLLRDVLSWLPKELDRLVIATREEEDVEPEADCPGCDEPADHGGECVLRIRVTGADVARDLEWDGALPIGDVINGQRPAVDRHRYDTDEDLRFDQMLENAK